MKNFVERVMKSTGPMSFISPRLRWLRQVFIWLMMFKSLTGFQARCVFCKIELRKWEPYDIPWVENARYANQRDFNCSFLNSPATCGNILYPENFEYGGNFTQLNDYANPESYGIDTSMSAQPLYSSEQARIDSYDLHQQCPSELKSLQQTLVQAGFLFTGSRDIVQCFKCGVRAFKWREGDDPWKEHAKHMSDCTYVKEKGPSYIKDISTSRKSIETLPNLSGNNSVGDDIWHGDIPTPAGTQSIVDESEDGFLNQMSEEERLSTAKGMTCIP